MHCNLRQSNAVQSLSTLISSPVLSFRAFLHDTGCDSMSSPGLFASYRESKSVFSRHLHSQYQLARLQFYYIFASRSQQGRTVLYSTSLAIFWHRTPCSGHTRRAVPVSCKNARFELAQPIHCRLRELLLLIHYVTL